MMKNKTARRVWVASLAAVALGLTGCAGGNDPLAGGDSSATAGGGSDGAIVVGSQAYYSNEIIAEIYAQALEGAGKKVERQFNIGQRDAYMPALESGEVTVFPEYTGNLLQWFDKNAKETESEAVYDALVKAMPDGLSVLEQAPATDQDSYTVTSAFAKEHSLTSIADLAGVTGITLGGNPELQTRPYGPDGLKSVYGVDVAFSPTADTTLDELLAGSIQVADVFTADPAIKTEKLVTLEDPKGLFLASHVVPVVNDSVKDDVAKVLDAVDAKLTTDQLIELNVQSVNDKKSAPDIAKAWLAAEGLSKG